MTDRSVSVPESRVRRLLRKLRRRAHSREGLWRSHLAVFGSVNAFLLFLNVVTPPTHPWFLYVLGAMSIPLGIHAILRRRRDRLQSTLEEWTETPAETPEIARIGRDLPDRLYRPIRRLHRSTTGWMLSAGIAGTVSGYLLLINALTGGSFWATIPVVSLAFPVTLGWILLRNRRAKLRRQIKLAEQQGLPPSPAVDPKAADHPAVTDAKAIQGRIGALIDSANPSHRVLADQVDEIVAEIERMAGLEKSFDAALAILPLPQLERDRDQLLRERESATPALRSQYGESLTQIDAQIESLQELTRNRELLSLRLRSGVNALRQVSLDMARLKGDETLAQINDQISITADELSSYMGDLQASYEELSSELGGE